jgi:hypothetical protein
MLTSLRGNCVNQHPRFSQSEGRIFVLRSMLNSGDIQLSLTIRRVGGLAPRVGSQHNSDKSHKCVLM